MSLDRKQIIWIGTLACVSAFMSVLADLFSGWSEDPSSMTTALSVDLDSIKGLFIEKPRWTFVLGNYLGVFFIPLHMLGFLLIYQVLLPAGRTLANAFLAGAFYFVAVGSGYHGTFASIGDTIQSGDAALLNKMVGYWYPWGLVVVAGYCVLCLFLMVLILSRKTLFPVWCALLTPLPIMVLGVFVMAVLPDTFHGTKSFITVTGLNLPLLLFYVVTLRVLLREADKSLER